MKKALSEMTLEELWQLFPIFLKEHDPYFKTLYAKEAAFLQRLIPGIRRISHIGNTAIEGIWAKPILDILLELQKDSDFSKAKDILTSNGYLLMNSRANGCTFGKGYTSEGFVPEVFHLHVRRAGDPDELYFRDYLNEHPLEAKNYEKLKLDLWKKYEFDRDGYTNAKGDFVKAVTQKARLIYANKYRLD